MREKDLLQAIDNTKKILTVIMFTDFTLFDRKISYKLKKAFFDISRNFKHNMFYYVDLKKYEGSVEKVTQDLKIPRFCFFYNSQNLGHVEGLNMEVFLQYLNVINSKLASIENSTDNGTDNNTGNNAVDVSENNKNVPDENIYQNQNISPEELSEIMKIKRKVPSARIKDLITAHIVQKQNVNQHDSLSEDDDEPVDPETLEQMKELQRINAHKNMLRVKQYQQIQFLKRVKQQKEIEEEKNRENNGEDKDRDK